MQRYFRGTVLLFIALVSFLQWTCFIICYHFSVFYISAKWLFWTITNRCLCRCTDEIVYPLLHSGYRRNSLWINPLLTGMNPVPAMWLSWTITKYCYWKYNFPIRLRENAICYCGNAMFKHRINFVFYDEMIWKRSFLFLLSILIRHLIKIKVHISELGRSRASAHELQLIDGGDFQKKMLVK